MLKVLHICAYPLEHPGGVEIFVKNLISHLDATKFKCEILTTDFKMKNLPDALPNHSKIHYMPYTISVWGKNPFFSIIRYIYENYSRFDLVHVHSYIHFSTLQACLLSKIFGFKLILTLHGGIQTKFMKVDSLSEKVQLFIKNYFFDKLWGYITLKSPNIVTSVSELDLKLISKVFHVYRKQNYWIPNAVSEERFFPKKNINRKFITFIGRLSYIKGFDIFVDLMNKLAEINPNVSVLIIGDGELTNLIERIKLKVIHIKRVDYNEMVNYYNETLIYILSSRYEGMPTTILEAMATKTPIAASNITAVQKLILPNKTGLLLDINQISASANYINDLIQNKTLQNELTSNAYNMFLNNYTWNKIAKKMEKLYYRLYNMKS